jgi:beta-aspartyl-peptidase (threonine type)
MRMLGEDVVTAADTVMTEVKALGGTGGVIVVGAAGGVASTFTTPGMNRGFADSSGRRAVAIFGDESLDER